MRLWRVRLGSTSGSDGVLAMGISARIDISPLDPAGTYLLYRQRRRDQRREEGKSKLVQNSYFGA